MKFGWMIPIAFVAASVYSLHNGWWNAAGWFGLLSFLSLSAVNY